MKYGLSLSASAKNIGIQISSNSKWLFMNTNCRAIIMGEVYCTALPPTPHVETQKNVDGTKKNVKVVCVLLPVTLSSIPNHFPDTSCHGKLWACPCFRRPNFVGYLNFGGGFSLLSGGSDFNQPQYRCQNGTLYLRFSVNRFSKLEFKGGFKFVTCACLCVKCKC